MCNIKGVSSIPPQLFILGDNWIRYIDSASARSLQQPIDSTRDKNLPEQKLSFYFTYISIL